MVACACRTPLALPTEARHVVANPVPHVSLGRVMNDTTATVEAMRLRALQAMSPARRLSLALGWSQSVRELTRSSLNQQHPELPPEELHRLLAERLLGKELASKAYGPLPGHG